MKTTKTTTTATKKCYIRTRYQIKSSGSVCARIVNGEGKEYTTCLHANGRYSCTCKAGEKQQLCYHEKHLRQVEARRNSNIESSSAQKEVQAQRAEAGEKASVSVPVAPSHSGLSTRPPYGRCSAKCQQC